MYRVRMFIILTFKCGNKKCGISFICILCREFCVLKLKHLPFQCDFVFIQLDLITVNGSGIKERNMINLNLLKLIANTTYFKNLTFKEISSCSPLNVRFRSPSISIVLSRFSNLFTWIISSKWNLKQHNKIKNLKRRYIHFLKLLSQRLNLWAYFHPFCRSMNIKSMQKIT